MLLIVHCVCKNFAGLVTVRLLLGVFEACVTPCLLLVVGMWYKRSEQPLRCGSFYLGVGSGTIIGAITSYGFQFYTAKVFKSWQASSQPTNAQMQC
jgi:MFS family permease